MVQELQKYLQSYLNYISKDIWTKPGNKSFSSAFPGDVNKYLEHLYLLQVAGIKMLQDRTDGSIAYNEASYATGLAQPMLKMEQVDLLSLLLMLHQGFLQCLL
jgi:hypothetical protein